MNTSQFVLRSFNIKPEESRKFVLLFLHSFFLGVFIAIYFVPANSVFIHHFGSEHLPIAYISSGIAGYLVSQLYSTLQKRVKSLTVFLVALGLMFFVPMIARMGLYYISEKWLSFFVFIWAGPFISLVNMESGGLTLRLLNLRQVKRLFGLINTGGIISAIIANFILPFILPLLNHAYDLLLIAESGVLLGIVVLILIYRKFPEEKVVIKKSDTRRSNLKFKKLIKDKYFRLIFLSACLSMVVVYFSDYGYLMSIKVQKTLFKTPEDISNFIAIICGLMKVGELIISLFSNRVLSKYGIKLGLTILPLSLTLFIILASISGFTIGQASILFFVVIVFNKSFERILRRGLDDPSFNILYQPLPVEQQLPVQTQTGVVMQFSIGIAGILLFIVSEILLISGTFNLKYFTLFFLPLLFAWVFVAFRLFLAYKARLRQMLSDKSKDKKREIYKYNYGIELLKRNLKNSLLDVRRMSTSILAETNPRMLEPYAGSLLRSEDPVIIKAILRSIDPSWHPRVLKYLEKLSKKYPDESRLQKLITETASKVDFRDLEKLSKEQVSEIIISNSYDDKITTIKLLIDGKIDDEKIISKLLEEKDETIIRTTAKLVETVNSKQLIEQLIRKVKSPVFYHVSRDSLLVIGDKVLPGLEKLFAEISSPILHKRVIEIYAKIGSPRAREILLSHINYPDSEVQLAVIRGLYFCKFQVSAEQRPVIRSKIEEIIENILWILATIRDIGQEKNTLKLIQSLDLEKENNFSILFKLLSFIYDPRLISLIRKNTIGENTIFALELIDNFMDPDIKQLITPLIDDISINQKIRKLRQLFPQKKLKLTERLTEIIIRDYNKVNAWTRAKAIELLGKIHYKRRKISTDGLDVIDEQTVELWTEKNVGKLLAKIQRSEMPDEIFLCLYHPEELIYTTAARIIYDENPVRCFDHLNRLSNVKQELYKTLKERKIDILIIERIKILKRLRTFFSIPENDLVKIAQQTMTVHVKQGEPVKFFNEDGSENVFLVVKGLLYYKEGENEVKFTKNDMIIRGISTIPDTKEIFAKKPTLILNTDRIHYFNLLVDEPEIIHYILEDARID